MERTERNTDFWLARAEAFTEAHAAGGDIALRELRCLRAQFPAVFRPIGEDDLFAGYTDDPLVGYRYSWSSELGHIGYFCDAARLTAIANDSALTETDRARAAALLDYWKERTTRALWERENPGWERDHVPGLCEIYPRLAEMNLDFDRLLRLGIPGLRTLVTQAAGRDPRPIHEALLGTVELLAELLRHLGREAAELAASSEGRRKKELLRMAETYGALAERAPDSFYGALCLFHLLVMITSVDNFARMDVYLGDFLSADLDRGVLTRTEALEIFVNLYRRYDRLFPTTGRIILGGEGRRNPENADRMDLLILDAARIVHGEAPTLCLRLCRSTPEEVWQKALDDLGAGCSYPLLYNDDVNVPGRMRAMRVPREDAEQYIMSNCGEYGLWGLSVHSPNGAINYAKVLELALFDGVDPMTGRREGPATGDGAAFASADDLESAFFTQSRFFIRRCTDRLRSIYDAAAEDSHNLLMSLLYHDCVERGLGLLSGARYRICDVETHAVVLVADAITAVRKVVFEDRRMTMGRLLDSLRADFEGYAPERSLLRRAPKFGNGDETADAQVRRISDFIHEETAAQAKRIGVHAVTASQITVDNYEVMGRYTGATPDGRFAFTPVTNSVNPSNGSDRKGVFALLRSMAGVDSSLSGGQVHHLKLSPSAFSPERRAATAGMLRAFFSAGAGEISVYTVRQEDLEDAVDHPEKHQDLIVRIGGYNARFVNLSPSLQREMLARSAYV